MGGGDIHLPGVLKRFAPTGAAIPLMFDSPHSGNVYPADFNHDCPRDKIRWGQDSFVDELYAAAPTNGAWLLAAEFPRTYIDPNRALEDMDPALVAGDWPLPVRDNPKSVEGIGLIWQNGGGGVEIYAHKLGVDEVQARIDGYWRPYHAAMAEIAGDIYKRWGRRWHINCHSMYSAEFAAALGKANVPGEDIVLGNRDGETCDAAFVDVVAGAFRTEGLSVAVNERFKGVELVRAYGDPGAGCHSLQIEIDRRLYMDERRIEKSSGFADLQNAMDRVIATIAGYVRNETGQEADT